MKLIFTSFFILIFSLQSFSIDNTDYLKFIKEGNNQRNQANYDSALFYFNKIISSKDFEDITIAHVLLNRGYTYQLKQDYAKALQDYNKALGIFKAENANNDIADTYLYLVEIYRHLGQFKKAQKYLTLTEQVIKQKNIKPRIIARYYNRKAAVVTESENNFQEVIKYSLKCIEISKKHGFRDLEASSYNEMGFQHYQKQDTLAIFYYKKALTIYEEIGDLRAQVHVLSNIARFFRVTGKYQQGIHYCDLGIAISKDKEWYLPLRTFYDIKSRCLYYSGQYKEAYLISEERLKASFKYIELINSKQLKELETKYEVVKKDKQITLAHLNADKAHQIAQNRLIQIKYAAGIGVLLAIILAISLYSFFKIKNTNNQLNQMIAQKEVLLQEVHHRVKNNLTVLNSLLYIQAHSSKNDETKRVLKECQGRIQSMALVHQNLYDVDNASEVDFNAFIRQLLDESKEIFGLQKSKINTHIETNHINFDMSFTIFLGLILNELITNSFKYAFTNHSENTIVINLKKEKDTYILSYSDSGKGLGKNFDLYKTSGFGFRLIKIMLNQIQGILTYSDKNNTFTITFKQDI